MTRGDTPSIAVSTTTVSGMKGSSPKTFGGLLVRRPESTDTWGCSIIELLHLNRKRNGVHLIYGQHKGCTAFTCASCILIRSLRPSCNHFKAMAPSTKLNSGKSGDNGTSILLISSPLLKLILLLVTGIRQEEHVTHSDERSTVGKLEL